MPTTITIDDDLAGLLQSAAQQKGKPVTEVAATLLRSALGKPATKTARTTPYRIHPHHGAFAPGIAPTKLNRLADELDTDAFLVRQAS